MSRQLVRIVQEVSISYILRLDEDSQLNGYSAQSIGALANSGLELELTEVFEADPEHVVAPKIFVRGYGLPVDEEI